MAKDPAFLFYSSDFLVGTFDMSASQVGYYIRLLCLQHAKGHLSKDLMTSVMDGNFDDAVACKFQVDESGCYFNARLDAESNKRNNYTESRRKNLSKTPTHMQQHMDKHMQEHIDEHMEEHMDKHMPLHMENVNVTNTNVSKLPKKKGVPGGNKHKHGMYANVLLTDDDLEKLKAEFPHDWAERIDILSEGMEVKGYKYKNHLATIRAWARKDGGSGYKRNSQGNAGHGDGTGESGEDPGRDGSEYGNLQVIRC